MKNRIISPSDFIFIFFGIDVGVGVGVGVGDDPNEKKLFFLVTLAVGVDGFEVERRGYGVGVR